MKSYEELRPRRQRATATPNLTPEARKEKHRRVCLAANRAKTVLTLAYPSEYRTYYLAAFAEVNAERGPLPGDDA